MSALAVALARLWAGFRTLLGDDAYERYCAHRAARHPDEPLPDRAAFYRAEAERRFRQASRCC